MLWHRKKWSGLTCHYTLPSAVPRKGVVLCHGYGAPGTDLLGIVPALLKHAPDLQQQVVWVFPEGLHSLSPYGYGEGRAWWPLDLERLQLSLQQGTFDTWRLDCPVGLAEARQVIEQIITQASRELGLDVSCWLVGGFSQGAMLATEVVLQSPLALGGLMVLSGSVINEQNWRQSPVKTSLPVFQSHGWYDPILPFFAAEWLHQLLQDLGCQVEFAPFPGGHEIPQSIVQRLAMFLQQNLDSV